MRKVAILATTGLTIAGGAGSLAFAIAAAQAQLQRPGNLCVVKYHDSNANGQLDVGEARLPGFMFVLFDPAGGQIAQVRTDRAGRGCFGRGVAAATYMVREAPLSGWRNTDPGGIPPEKPAIVQAGRTTEIFFGNCNLERDRPCRRPPPRPGGLCVVKYHDSNGNGRRDSGEATLPGWTFKVTQGSGAQPGSATTDRGGRACFERMRPGSYTVEESPVLSGWHNTDPGVLPAVKTGVVQSGRTTELLFGNCNRERDRNCGPTPPPGELCVSKYEDLNGNGKRDAGEGPLAGWRFLLLGSNGSPKGQMQTGENGRACFGRGIAPGSYVVREDPVVPGWMNTDPGGVLPTKPVTVPPGGTVHVSFGNCQRSGEGKCKAPGPDPGRLCIRKYEDLNGDGVRQNNEPWAVGWKFTIHNSAGQLVGQTTSGPVEDEACENRMLPAGSYQVREDLPLPSGWKNTEPGGTQPQKGASVTAGNITYVLFGNQKIPTSTLTVRKEVSVDGMPHGQFGPPPAWVATTFTVDVNCGGAITSHNLSSANNYTAKVTGIAVGTKCTATEQPPAPLTISSTWLTTYHPSQTVQIGTQPQTVTVRNVQNMSGVQSPGQTKLVIETAVAHPLWNTGAYPPLEFAVAYACNWSGGSMSKSAKISPKGNPAPASVEEVVPVGTTCQVEEVLAALPSLAGTQVQHCTWAAPEYRWDAVGQPVAVVPAKANLQLTVPQQMYILQIRNHLNC